MALYFISGVSGTGKTTLAHELLHRGVRAYDMDNECVRMAKDEDTVVSYEDAKLYGYRWIYPSNILYEHVQSALNTDIYLLGIVDNLEDVKSIAHEFIWMHIPKDTLIKRLADRKKHYGKSERERELILRQYEDMNSSIDPTTFILDATRPVQEIANDPLIHTTPKYS